MTGQPDFFTETAVTLKRKVEKSIARWEMNRHSDGYKWVNHQNWGLIAKNRIFWPKTEILGSKNVTLLGISHVLATTGKSCSKKKVAFAHINISLLRNFG